jgi:hypothetical protein
LPEHQSCRTIRPPKSCSHPRLRAARPRASARSCP